MISSPHLFRALRVLRGGQTASSPLAMGNANAANPAVGAASESSHAAFNIATDRGGTTAVSMLVILVWLIAASAIYRASDSIMPAANAVSAVTQIDPNTAPWWELSLLPHIGDALARDIARFRSTAGSVPPVFRRPADLDEIRGIGPKTIQRLARHLRFPPAADPALVTWR